MKRSGALQQAQDAFKDVVTELIQVYREEEDEDHIYHIKRLNEQMEQIHRKCGEKEIMVRSNQQNSLGYLRIITGEDVEDNLQKKIDVTRLHLNVQKGQYTELNIGTGCEGIVTSCKRTDREEVHTACCYGKKFVTKY